MRQNPNESNPPSDRKTERAVGEAGAEAEWSQSDSELLRALAASVDKNEWAQEKFRNAVVRKLARLEARARVLQLSKIVDWLPGGSVAQAAEREAGIDALVSEVSEEIERKIGRHV